MRDGAPGAAAGSPGGSGTTDLSWYEIRLESHLDASWAEWLGGLELRWDGDGTTVLSGPIPDQAALHGLLARVRDLGVPLLAVVRLTPGDQDRSEDRGERGATPTVGEQDE